MFETQSSRKITDTLSVCISKSNSLLLFRQMVTFCCKTQMEFINTLCDSVECLIVRHALHVHITLFYVVKPRKISFSYTLGNACG